MEILDSFKSLFKAIEESHELVIIHTVTREYEGMVDVDTHKYVIKLNKD